MIDAGKIVTTVVITLLLSGFAAYFTIWKDLQGLKNQLPFESSSQQKNKTEENFYALDQRIKKLESFNTAQGSIIAAFRGACPKGWVEHDESEGRFLLGISTGQKILQVGGSPTHLLTKEELPNFELLGSTDLSEHSHSSKFQFSITDGEAHSDNPRAGKTDGGRYDAHTPTLSLSKERHSHKATVKSGGDDKPHNNMPPYIVVRWCIPRI